MIFVLKMLFTFLYDRKNENHWSLLIYRYSLRITHYSEYKHRAYIHIFVFIDHKNNRFQKKMIVQNI